VNILLVHAHPVPGSFSHALRTVVADALRGSGHAVDVLDLYAEGFAPALTEAERRAYHDVPANIATVQDHVARLQRAEALVLVFPTWWYGMPAILKGWFDRVWAPGVAFDISPQGIAPRLTNITRFAVVTTTGSPWWLVALYLGNPVKKVLMRGIRRLLAPGADAHWHCLHHIDASTPAQRMRFLARVKAAFEGWGTA
jgi:putative NADPH-quinone reductase